MSFDVKGEKPRHGWISRGISVLTIAGLAAFGLAVKPQEAKGFNVSTHKYLSSQGIFLLKGDKGESVVTNLYEKVNDKGQSFAEVMMQYSQMPDFDENDNWQNTGHYYNPATGANIAGDKANTANVRLRDHYGNAVKAYSEGKKELAAVEFGRALHYEQDMNSAPHTAGITGFPHNVYESYAESHQNEYSIYTSASDIAYRAALANNIWVYGHDTAIKSSQDAYLVKSFSSVMNTYNLKIASKRELTEGQVRSAALMFKYLADTNRVPAN